MFAPDTWRVVYTAVRMLASFAVGLCTRRVHSQSENIISRIYAEIYFWFPRLFTGCEVMPGTYINMYVNTSTAVGNTRCSISRYFSGLLFANLSPVGTQRSTAHQPAWRGPRKTNIKIASILWPSPYLLFLALGASHPTMIPPQHSEEEVDRCLLTAAVLLLLFARSV